MKWFKAYGESEYALKTRGAGERGLPIATLSKCGDIWKLNGVCGIEVYSSDDGIKEANNRLINAYKNKMALYKKYIDELQAYNETL